MTEKQIAWQVYLQSRHWQNIRQKALERDGYKCVECSSTENLRVHHWQYRETGYMTKLQDVYTLCQLCHEKVHKIRKDKAGHVVSMVQMKSALKPVYCYNPLAQKHRKKRKKRRAYKEDFAWANSSHKDGDVSIHY